MRIWKAGLFAVLLGLAACKRGNVDTTKDYYEDSEAPEYQDYEVNGNMQRIPWKEVPENRRYLTTEEKGKDGVWRDVVRVPIIRVEIQTLDKDGNPVDPKSDKVVEGRGAKYGLNPKHVQTSILGGRH